MNAAAEGRVAAGGSVAGRSRGTERGSSTLERESAVPAKEDGRRTPPGCASTHASVQDGTVHSRANPGEVSRDWG